MSPWLTQEQITSLTGYKIASKQREALNAMAIDYRTRPDGSLVVMHCDLGFTKPNSFDKKEKDFVINV